MAEITKIFVASSSELKSERDEISDLILDLNDLWRENSIILKSVKWEFMDSSMSKIHKQEEYLDNLRKCEICIVMFWNSLGEYTRRELNIAVEEMIAKRLPKQVVVLYKEPAEFISEELKKFKEIFKTKHPDIPTFSFNGKNELRSYVESIITEYLTK